MTPIKSFLNITPHLRLMDCKSLLKVYRTLKPCRSDASGVSVAKPLQSLPKSQTLLQFAWNIMLQLKINIFSSYID